MNEAQARQKAVGVMQSWVGIKEGSSAHKEILKLYNDFKTKSSSYVVKNSDAWCATTVSAALIDAGFADIFPLECSCGRMIELAKKMGIWKEDDAYVPDPGDAVLYDWNDTGVGDNTGWPEHIGMVEKIVGNTITVIEGNYNDAVGRRNIQINGKFIRGFITPNYESKADKEESEVNTTVNLKIGDVVNFTGNKQYGNSFASAKAIEARAGKARITAINKSGSHPYHIIAVSGSGAKVYGWVDANDINGNSDVTINVGDEVVYNGTVHYTSSYAGAKGKPCKGGTAKVTAIRKGNPYPYHLVHTGKGCTVYGWVEADKVTK